MSASPLTTVAVPPEAAAVAITDATASTTDLATAATAATNEDFRLDDQELLGVFGDVVLSEQSLDGESGIDDAELEPEAFNVILDASEQSLELVFVDSAVGDMDQMVNDLRSADSSDENRTLEIIVVGAKTDGMDQISSALQNYTDVDSIHIVSHGRNQCPATSTFCSTAAIWRPRQKVRN